MPREKYKRTSTRSSWSEENMKRALRAVNEKVVSIRKAAKMFDVPYGTLQDRIKGRFSPKKYKLGRKSVFTAKQEAEFASHIISLSKVFYGLTAKSVRELAYQFAETNGLKHNFNKDKKICGKDWLYSFLRRNPMLSLRKPEATNLSRVLAFNKEEVTMFFDNLQKLYDGHTFEAHRIFNVDETGISNVHVPSRIIANKGQKQVGAITSGERGQLVTVVVAMSAAGHFVPPMFIFKRERMKEGLQKNGPTGAIYRCSKSGWITEQLFTEWIKHFANYTKATTEDPVMLVMDNHSTHSNLATYNFCRENGIKVISIPPHTSHRLQPLDVCFFAPLKIAYNQECDRYIKTKQYEKILQTDIADLFKNAYNRTATVEKGVRAFEVTGIFPCNRFIFSDEEFATSTNVEIPISDVQNQEPHTAAAAVPHDPINKRFERTPSPIPGPSNYKSKRLRRSSSTDSNSSLSNLDLDEVVNDNITDDEDKTLQPKIGYTSFSELLPLPKIKTRYGLRKTQHSKIMTSTPLKEELEKKENKRNIKKEKVSKVKRCVVPENKRMDEDTCSICQGFGGKNELWWRCRSCGSWAHADCTDIEHAEHYICVKC